MIRTSNNLAKAHGFSNISSAGFGCCAGAAVHGILIWTHKPTQKDYMDTRCSLSGKIKFFCGRKMKKFGLNSQAVSSPCWGQILDISILYPGLISDCLAFKGMPLFVHTFKGGILASGLWIFGDNAYLNTAYMMGTPFQAELKMSGLCIVFPWWPVPFGHFLCTFLGGYTNIPTNRWYCLPLHSYTTISLYWRWWQFWPYLHCHWWVADWTQWCCAIGCSIGFTVYPWGFPWAIIRWWLPFWLCRTCQWLVQHAASNGTTTWVQQTEHHYLVVIDQLECSIYWPYPPIPLSLR